SLHRKLTATVQPPCPSSLAVAAPILRLAPVTSTTPGSLPSSPLMRRASLCTSAVPALAGSSRLPTEGQHHLRPDGQGRRRWTPAREGAHAHRRRALARDARRSPLGSGRTCCDRCPARTPCRDRAVAHARGRLVRTRT